MFSPYIYEEEVVIRNNNEAALFCKKKNRRSCIFSGRRRILAISLKPLISNYYNAFLDKELI